jgi:D-alanyl-D-alanine carboxypeptidase/D-alanyl-D-alanine-endopeptidase (penicillin-binding protein 4)
VDGTMKKRLHGKSITGQAHIKTGTLEGVKTLAGYVLDKNGRQQIVVFFINHSNAQAAEPAQDALLTWIYEGSSY